MSALLFGLGGAVIGGLSTLISGKKQKDALRAQKENAWQRYLINKEFGDAQFGINKGEALTSLGIQQGRLREDVDTGVGNFNTGLLGQAYGIQDAQIGLAGQLGAHDAAQGMSGTRGNEANGLTRAYAQKSFDQNVGLQNKQNDAAIGSIMTGATRGNQDIERERESWGEGGYRTLLYNAEDERNLKLARLGQTEYDSAISAANPGIFDYLAGGFSGASLGLSLYSGIQEAKRYGDGKDEPLSPSGLVTGTKYTGTDPYAGTPSPSGLLSGYPTSDSTFNSVGGGGDVNPYDLRYLRGGGPL
jgi:hypothetical protein